MISYWKIIGNGGVSFCTSLLAVLALGQTDGLQIAFLIAILQGSLAAFLEIQKEAGALPPAAQAALGAIVL